jgi:hypothetical protein
MQAGLLTLNLAILQHWLNFNTDYLIAAGCVVTLLCQVANERRIAQRNIIHLARRMSGLLKKYAASLLDVCHAPGVREAGKLG